jgi:uncharacterized protein
MKPSGRRNFLRNATGLVAAGLIGNTITAKAGKVSGLKLDDAALITRTLGRTGLKIPVVSMGVMNSNNPNLLKASWQMGMRHFDTAWIYQNGNNEKMVGSVLKDMKVDRKEVIITTKIIIDENLWRPEAGELRKQQLLTRFAQSLERLQMDYVDILMFHAVSSPEQVMDPFIISALKELKDQGKIRFPAFSTHVDWPELLNAAVDYGFYDVALLSFNYSMSQDERFISAIKNASAKGVGIIAMKTQCQQEWYKQNLPAETQKFYEGNIMHAALLKWVLRHEEITTAVPGFSTFDQLQTDISVAHSLEYSTEEEQFLKDHQVKVALQSVCHICGTCIKSCPKGADIPSLMRTHMYAFSYGNPHMSKITNQRIEKGKGLEICNECEECVATCKNNVQIAARLDDLKVLMA